MKSEQVILVTREDKPLGTMEKMEVHRKGELHRAFSIFIVNDKDEILLQQRADSKYHSSGLWTNTCCSHPRPGEETIDAARRRLGEEMGIHCDLEEVFSFIYKAKLDNNLTEHELDHVFIGHYSGEPKVNPQEVKAWKYQTINEITNGMKSHPQNYTAWFKPALDEFIARGVIQKFRNHRV